MNPHGIRKPFYGYHPNQEAKRPTRAGDNHSKPGAKHARIQPKPTTRKQSLPQPASHLAYHPPHKKPTRERRTRLGRRKTQLQWLHAPPPDRESNQSHRAAEHHTKTSPKAKVEGAKFGVSGMPRGGQRKLRTQREARRPWKETRKTSYVNQSGGCQNRRKAPTKRTVSRGGSGVCVSEQSLREEEGTKPTNTTNRCPAGRPRAEQRDERTKPERQSNGEWQ